MNRSVTWRRTLTAKRTVAAASVFLFRRKMMMLLMLMPCSWTSTCTVIIMLAFLCENDVTAENTLSPKQAQRRMDDLLKNVDKYEVVYPKLFDVPRPKRDIESSKNALNYQVAVQGKELKLNLVSNQKLVSGKYRVEVWDKEGRVLNGKKNRPPRPCYYHGKVANVSESFVAISNCHGLHGLMVVNGQEFLIEPYWNFSSDTSKDNHPHVVYSFRDMKAFKNGAPQSGLHFDWKRGSGHFGRSNLNRRHRPQNGRRTRSISGEHYVEALVVADKKTVHFHGERNVETYILTIMNVVSMLYSDASIGNAIYIIVSKVVLLTDDQPGLKIRNHAWHTLTSFCRWQSNSRLFGTKLQGKNIHRHDNAILITRHDICYDQDEPCDTLGLAQVSGMCKPDHSCSVNQDTGLASGFTISHELGHNFGMQHDGTGNKCGIHRRNHLGNTIMSTQLTVLSHPIQWSACSRAYLTDFLDSGQGECLKNVPSFKESTRELPGQRFSADQQCKFQYGTHASHCKERSGSCQELWCRVQRRRCVTNNVPAMDGTVCKASHLSKGWCIMGNCVEFGSLPTAVDGQWGNWTEWGKCSRTCGGGVRVSERFCSDPSPEYGGKFCVGERKRYEICNVQDCLGGSVDFRLVQCSRFNQVSFRGKDYEWVPLTGDHVKPCALYCKAVGFSFYVQKSPKVIDGTRCGPDSSDVCVNGQCKRVGCDGRLDSKAKEDKCRVCAGDGSTCDTMEGLATNPYYDHINSYVHILSIPQGAVNIEIAEAVATRNYLALRSMSGQYLLNGMWVIHWPMHFDSSGTKFHYQRAENEPESLTAKGPISEEIMVMLLLVEENRGIRYSYNVPRKRNLIWKRSQWSECSKSCAVGKSFAKSICVEEGKEHLPVNDSFCAPSELLIHSHAETRTCNEHPCPPELLPSEWSECSQSCDSGIQTRTLSCIQRRNDIDYDTINMSNCDKILPKPEMFSWCNEHPCHGTWQTGPWTECDLMCGTSYKHRNVTCLSANLKECEEDKRPISYAKCKKRRCPDSRWLVGKWSQCNVTCGNGMRERYVHCNSWHGKTSDAKCTDTNKPLSIQHCQVPCPTLNKQEANCTDINEPDYCRQVVKFKYCGRGYFRKACCNTCSAILNKQS